jgi:SAM-dependent methyltransferase
VHDPWAPTRAAYDTVAGSYAELVSVDRTESFLDRAVLDDFAARVRGRGRVLDAGCGPGRLTRHLADRGVDVSGMDLSPEMVRIARERHPDLTFTTGSIDAPGLPAGSFAGVLAWYSVIHTPPAQLPTVVGALLELLAVGGWLLVGCQSGAGERHLAHAYGHDIDLTAYLHTAEDIARTATGRGGVVHVRLTRGPEPPETRPQAFVLVRRA